MATTPLPLRLDRAASTALPVQLADGIRARITGGGLRPGDRLPGSRTLARELGVSRAVVEQGYEQLLAEGWVEGRQGSGTFIASGVALGTAPVSRTIPPHESPPDLIRLGTGTPWIEPRHHDDWRRAWREVATAVPPRTYPEAGGLPALREELAAYTARTRGVDCAADEVLVTHGTTDGWRHLLGVLPPGPVGVEDPGYAAAVATARQHGRTVLDLPVDDEGVALAGVCTLPPDVRAVYTTPAHQHPTGVTMSARRRVALLAEAARGDWLVVEDDYDSEFRYDVAPLPALAALDRERVIHLRTASKAVSPGLRLGWLVGPAALVAEIAARRAATHDLAPWPVQRAWLALLRAGYVDKMVRSSRRVYADRRVRVQQALAAFDVPTGPSAGMYLTVPLPPAVVAAVRADLAREGFDVPSLAESSRSSGLTGLVIGFGGVDDDQLDRALAALTASLERHTG